jgi:ABC-type glycerol-3-phosphate transport system permease component
MKRRSLELLLTYTGLLITYAILLLPIGWLIVSSFRSNDSIQTGKLVPALSELTLTNYVEVFAINNVFVFLVNSVVIATSVMLLVVIFGSLGAYA